MNLLTISGEPCSYIILLLVPVFLTPHPHPSAEEALQYPVLTFASGPTNSMRGAVFLSGLKNAIVVDIGGTTSDVGVLKDGFPREASTQLKVLFQF